MNAAPVEVGDVTIDPQRRLLAGPSGSSRLQPQAMAVLELLAERPGEVTARREIFSSCWGDAPVGDDSLNRIVSHLRRALGEVGSQRISIETVPRGGYAFIVESMDDCSPASVAPDPREQAMFAWRLGAPTVDADSIADLERWLSARPDDHRAWGLLALLLTKAAEYAPADQCVHYIHRCEAAANAARRGTAGSALGEIAVALVTPIFGNWLTLRKTLQHHIDEPVAQHEMAVLEMSTGRVSAAVPLVERLIAADPLAAQLHYKRMYHLWALGDLGECERVSLSALQLWPRHAAIWFARFWILLGTGRPETAARLVGQDSDRPPLPAAAFAFLHATAKAAMGQGDTTAVRDALAQDTRAFAANGPANAVAALLASCALQDIDDAFAVAEGYYLGLGASASPARPGNDGMSISDQHRRVTQPLFLPIAKGMRADPRFMALCERIGLARYWSAADVVPDFLAVDQTV